MSIFHRTPALRWLVPAAAAALIFGGGAAIGTVTAAAEAPLPARSAAQLIADVHDATLSGLSGTVVQTSDLGLPDLPSIGTAPLLGGQGSSDLTSLISGTHTLRLWYAGPQQVRIALLGSLGESDVIRNGNDLWTWSSTRNTATHRTLPAGAGDERAAVTGPLGSAVPASPQQAAEQALGALTPSTTITSEPGVIVAGRSAYELVLQPKDTRSLVAGVRIAIDAAEHVPLRVQIFARGQQDPAFQVGFTSVDFSRPDPAEFTFDPPPGATVDRAGPVGGSMRGPAEATDPGGILRTPGGAAMPGTAVPSAMPPAGGTRIVGSGWTSVLVTSAEGGPGAVKPLAGGTGHPDRPATAGAGGELDRVLSALPRVSGTWGSGRLFATALLSAVITDNGRIAIGAVPPDMLYAALASP